MNRIEINMFLSETNDAQEKWVVREFNDEGHLLRTRVVGSEEEANGVKTQWQKR